MKSLIFFFLNKSYNLHSFTSAYSLSSPYLRLKWYEVLFVLIVNFSVNYVSNIHYWKQKQRVLN